MFSRQDSIRVMKLWADYEGTLNLILETLLKQYNEEFSPYGDQWEHAKRAVEYQAKKQVLIELKRIFSRKYE